MTHRRTFWRYARAGGPPNNWWNLRVVNLATGLDVARVVEVNAAEGWLVMLVRDPLTGAQMLTADRRAVRKVRVEGAFAIVALKSPAYWRSELDGLGARLDRFEREHPQYAHGMRA